MTSGKCFRKNNKKKIIFCGKLNFFPFKNLIMLESPISCSSSSIPATTVFLPINEQPTPLTNINSPSPVNDEIKTTTTTNYIEIGCKENDEKFSRKIEPNYYRNEQNFHQQQQQQQQPQNDQREPTAYKKFVLKIKFN